MKCEEVRDELVAFARHELDPDRTLAVEEHLARCQGCTKELDNARQVLAITQMADDDSIVRLVNNQIKEAVKAGASDLHVEPPSHHGGGPVPVRWRLDGVLTDAGTLTHEQHAAVIARIKRMAGMNVADRRSPQDGRIALSVGGKEFDLRVSVLPFLAGEGAVIRILDRGSLLASLEQLEMEPETLRQVEALLAHPNGLIVVSGPTASGKSTLLHAMMARLSHREANTLSIEDPVEYAMPGVRQTSVDRKAGWTFAAALRAFLRHDPDVVMVAQLPDVETADLAVQMALTGHLVLTSMDTGDTTGVLTRLQEMGVPAFQVAASLLGATAQRLARRICDGCRQEYQPQASQLAALGFAAGAAPATFTRGAGCDKCAQTGFRGRVCILEVLTLNDDLRRMVADGGAESAIRSQALEQGALRPLVADARAKVAAGVTTLEEVNRVLRTTPGRW